MHHKIIKTTDANNHRPQTLNYRDEQYQLGLKSKGRHHHKLSVHTFHNIKHKNLHETVLPIMYSIIHS